MNFDINDISQVERRVGAITAVRRVVHAIWALARAQLPRVEEAAANSTIFLNELESIVDRFAFPSPPVAERRVLKVVLGPERPFCGSIHRSIAAEIPREGPIALVGARLRETADGALTARMAFGLEGPAGVDDLAEVAESIAAELLALEDIDAVELLHPVEGSSRLHRVSLIGGERPLRPEPPETFSPIEEVLHGAVEQLVASRVVVGLAESLRAEIKARISAADAARRACDEALEELEKVGRVLRKEAMTSEILELVAGQLVDER